MASSTMMIALLAAVCVCCVCVAVGIYFYTQNNSPAPSPDTSGTPGPAPAPGPVDPRASVWASGQSIQSAPFDTQAATTAFTTSPTGYSGTPTYTMSLDINIEKTATSWRNIFAHQPTDSTGDGGNGNSSITRKPSLYITGLNSPPANRVQVVHQQAGSDNTSIVTKFAATPGTYFNLTWVVNGGVLKAYINGVLDSTVSAAFTWPSPDQPWTWMHANYAAYKNGAITVANVYWWNSALTDAQVAQLAIPSAPTPGVDTTSYYMPEPYTKY
jgi:Concanavalin A-like lectin/glucanases superfamily